MVPLKLPVRTVSSGPSTGLSPCTWVPNQPVIVPNPVATLMSSLPTTVTAQPPGPLASFGSGHRGLPTLATPPSTEMATRSVVVLPFFVVCVIFMLSVSS